MSGASFLPSSPLRPAAVRPRILRKARPAPGFYAGCKPLHVGSRRLPARPLQAERNAARPPPACGAGARLYGAEGIGRRYCRHAGGQPSARGVGACSSAVQTQEVDSKTGEGAAAGRTGYAIESNEKSPALQVPVGRRSPKAPVPRLPCHGPARKHELPSPGRQAVKPRKFRVSKPVYTFWRTFDAVRSPFFRVQTAFLQ